MMECGHADAYSKLMKLQAENERLRKAGDDMAWALMGNPTVEAWNAAKGVQP
jgi:aryl carrier-like protein